MFSNEMSSFTINCVLIAVNLFLAVTGFNLYREDISTDNSSNSYELKCGESREHWFSRDKIAGGRTALQGEFPWQV